MHRESNRILWFSHRALACACAGRVRARRPPCSARCESAGESSWGTAHKNTQPTMIKMKTQSCAINKIRAKQARTRCVYLTNASSVSSDMLISPHCCTVWNQQGIRCDVHAREPESVYINDTCCTFKPPVRARCFRFNVAHQKIVQHEFGVRAVLWHSRQ